MTAGNQHHEHGREPSTQAGDRFTQAFWDERYGSSAAIWSGQPNPQLIAETSDLLAGVALDVGCGEGADAIWLAERGWRVTAVDISTVALGRGAARARGAGADIASRITWHQADVLAWTPPTSTYDLVSVQFMQLPPEPRDTVFSSLATGVADGGTLLVVGHSPSDLSTTAHRPPMPELFFTASEVTAILVPSQWTIVVSEARSRDTRDPDGQMVAVRDEVLVARRGRR